MALFGRLFGNKPAPRPVAKPVKQTPFERMKVLRAGAKILEQPETKPVAVPQPITLGRSSPPTGRRTSVPVPHAFISAFIAGTHTYVTSSLVSWAKYDQKAQELTLGFLPSFYGGAIITYEDISESEAAEFYAAPSKGGWVLDNLWGPLIPGTHRHVGLKRWH